MDLNKLYAKYVTTSPIRPPRFDEELKIDIPVEKDELSNKWIRLLQEVTGRNPLTEQSLEDILEILRSDPAYDIPASSIGGEASTIKPPKNAAISPDTLLKLCGQYSKLVRF